jgi:biotin carboxyl carrier protein
MKLNAQLFNTDHEIEITLDPVDDGVVADVDGRSLELEVRELASGEYLILHDTTVFRCRVQPKPHQRNSFEVSLRGHSYDITVIDRKRLRSGHASGVHDHGAAEIVSPMPGKVVRLLVEVGNPVKVGDGVVVVEAMKMQNELKSPKAGVVLSINAEAGATVNAGDVLAVIE